MKGVILILKNIFKIKTMAVVLCGVLAVPLMGHIVNAQGSRAALEQPIRNQKLETSVNLQMKEDKIVLDFALTNHSDQTSKLQFSSGQQFEVVITDEKGKEVYRFSEGKLFTEALIYKDLKASQSIKWQDMWDMIDKDGEKLTSGKYTAEISVLARSRDKEIIDKSQLTAEIDFNLSELAAGQFIPDGAQFINPPEPKESKNFIEIDLNNDGTHEVACFYKDRSNSGVLLLEQQDKRWNLKDQIQLSADNLIYAGFSDLDGDSKAEILLGTNVTNRHKQLSVYKLQGDKYKYFYKLDYDSFSLGDLDNNGTVEIASIIRKDEEIPLVQLQVHTLLGGSYIIEQELDLADGSYPDQVVIGIAQEGKQAIFVDLGIGAHSGLTEIIIKENGNYKKALAFGKGDELQPAFKPYPLLSQDINNDGIIEVGIQVSPPETDNLPMAEIPWINYWYQWDGKEGLLAEPILQEFSNYDAGYRFLIPDNWNEKFTIKNNINQDAEITSAQFIYLGNNKMTAELLTINVIAKENWFQQEQMMQKNKHSYLLLGENDKNVLVAQLPGDNSQLSAEDLKDYKQMLLDQKEVKQRFSSINNNIRMLYDEKGFLKPEFAKKAIKDTADKMIYALSIKDSDILSAYVHPLKGLRFTPYTYVSPEQDVVFNAAEVKNIFKNENTYLWGYYDGSGYEILLTPSDYYDKFIYSKDFLNAEKIGYNEVLSFGNMLENQFEVYQNAIIVEYYFSGFNPDYAGMDWRSLRLVFEEYEGSWKLVGLINNQWTI